ncbi:hypothetical protein [Roseovarius sp. EL26]|uniref:hypothetical protein n=1 Tax=Roseovarius sp. EL26 TaxID=2126672 RepID=UPI000EA12191|nr:hypothetical protein [Roseovarius sp. EL26]
MNHFWIIWVGLSAVVVILTAIALIRHRRKPKQTRGTTPSQNGFVVTSNYAGDHDMISARVISRDPQEYAKTWHSEK